MILDLWVPRGVSGSTVACEVSGVSRVKWRVFKLIGYFTCCKPRVRCYEVKSELHAILWSCVMALVKEGEIQRR